MKALQCIIIIAFILGCSSFSRNQDQVKKLYAGSFEMKIPKNWNFVKEQGIDSYVGFIKTPSSSLYFDHSSMGYANNLLPSVEEYLERELRLIPNYIFPAKPGVYYVKNRDLPEVKKEIMQEKGITDSSLVIVEEMESPKEVHLEINNNKYFAILSYRDTTIRHQILIDEEVDSHYFELDTISNFYRKIIYPKVPGKGMTGVYMKDLSSITDFQMNGKDLSPEDQSKAIKAYKSIILK